MASAACRSALATRSRSLNFESSSISSARSSRSGVRSSTPGSPPAVVTRRLVEVELHHCDLGAGYGPGDWPAAFAAMELAEPMRSLREDRLRRAQQASPATD